MDIWHSLAAPTEQDWSRRTIQVAFAIDRWFESYVMRAAEAIMPGVRFRHSPESRRSR